MPEQRIGIRGYIGELIVYQYLCNKFPEKDGYKTIKEIIPSDAQKKGGAFLDFAVIKGKTIKRIYEVKTQDFIFGENSRINPALEFIWKNNPTKFEDSEGKSYSTTDDFNAFLVLLVPPNLDFCKKIKKEKIILFSELVIDGKSFLKSLDNKEINQIILEFKKDLEEEIKTIKKPTKGKRILKPFLDSRNS